MAKESFGKILKRLEEEKSHKETYIKACKALIRLQRQFIAAMTPKNAACWRDDDLRMHACYYKRLAVEAERILRGKDAAKRLNEKLKKKVPPIVGLTDEQKAEQAAIPFPAPTGYTGYYSPRTYSKQKSLFNPNGYVHGERDS